MKNKFCVNKTVAYLVLLVAVVVGAFYTINIVNTQKQATDTEAAAAACKENGVKGVLVSKTCSNYAKTMNTPFHAYTAGNVPGRSGLVKFNCCIPEKKVDAYTGRESKSSCKDKKNEIAAIVSSGCTYYTGDVTSKGMCAVAPSNDAIACLYGKGQPLSSREYVLKDFCKKLAGKAKSGMEGFLYTGDYYRTGNYGSIFNYCIYTKPSTSKPKL